MRSLYAVFVWIALPSFVSFYADFITYLSQLPCYTWVYLAFLSSLLCVMINSFFQYMHFFYSDNKYLEARSIILCVEYFFFIQFYIWTTGEKIQWVYPQKLLCSTLHNHLAKAILLSIQDRTCASYVVSTYHLPCYATLMCTPNIPY